MRYIAGRADNPPSWLYPEWEECEGAQTGVPLLGEKADMLWDGAAFSLSERRSSRINRYRGECQMGGPVLPRAAPPSVSRQAQHRQHPMSHTRAQSPQQ